MEKSPINGKKSLQRRLNLYKENDFTRKQEDMNLKYKNKSVVLTNISNKMVDFDPKNINQYPLYQNEKPKIREIFAFKYVQLQPNSVQMVQYVAELKKIHKDGEIMEFLILFDGNQMNMNKNIYERHKLHYLISGNILKYQRVNFDWSNLTDVRLIQSKDTFVSPQHILEREQDKTSMPNIEKQGTKPSNLDKISKSSTDELKNPVVRMTRNKNLSKDKFDKENKINPPEFIIEKDYIPKALGPS